jgi:hypothetical protein
MAARVARFSRPRQRAIRAAPNAEESTCDGFIGAGLENDRGLAEKNRTTVAESVLARELTGVRNADLYRAARGGQRGEIIFVQGELQNGTDPLRVSRFGKSWR